MVEIDAGQYLLDAMTEVGPVSSNGFDLSPQSWAEIVAFANGTGAIGEPWEIAAVKRMCAAYCNARRAGKSAMMIMPMERGLNNG